MILRLGPSLLVTALGSVLLASCAPVSTPKVPEFLVTASEDKTTDARASDLCQYVRYENSSLIAAVDSTSEEVESVKRETGLTSDSETGLPENGQEYVAVCIFEDKVKKDSFQATWTAADEYVSGFVHMWTSADTSD